MKYVVFDFSNTGKADIPDHAESVVNNNFNATGAGTTINSKTPGETTSNQ